MAVFPFHNTQYGRSREIRVGNLWIGGNYPVVIQSMTTSRTIDTEATVRQIIRLADAGCEVVRMAVQNKKEARNLGNIKSDLLRKGYDLPLVADVHFNPEIAGIAARHVEKVRINPGNFTGGNQNKKAYSEREYFAELENAEQKLIPLLKICQENNTAIRIGVNHGSLSNRILVRYGNTAEGMVASAMEFIRLCRRHNFDRLTLSLKASDVPVMIKANKLLADKMIEEDAYYPVHLGVTEAGAGIDGRLKSAAGIGHLLMLGIGDTIRVSLTEDPEEEIPVARKLVELYGKKNPPEILAERIEIKADQFPALKPPYVVSCGKSEVSDFSLERHHVHYKGEKTATFETVGFQENNHQADNIHIIKLNYSGDPETIRLRAAAEFAFLQDHYPADGIFIDYDRFSSDEHAQLAFDILQALGLRLNKAEYIACPSCGRTYFDIQEHLKEIRKKTTHLKGLKIAVMGCVVNGPGEMAGADYGYVGSGKGKINLYKGTSLIRKNLDETSAVDALIELIKENGDW